MKPVLTLVALVILSACAYVAPRFKVYGSPRDIELLSGEWWGEYMGDVDHARRGSVTFKLIAGEGHAHGDVLMKPDGRDQPYQRLRVDEGDRQRPGFMPKNPVLSIRFVYVGDGVVSGELDPYWDPDRGTEATATFRGSIDGGTIEGTFTTRYSSGAAKTEGRWKVTRRPLTP